MTSAAEIAKALGGRRSGTGYVAKCPAHEDLSPSFSICDSDDGKILVHCFVCDQHRLVDTLRRKGLWPNHGGKSKEPTEAEREAQRQRDREREKERARREAFVRKSWQDTWAASVPLIGSPIERWLEVRGIDAGKLDLGRLECLRWACRCPLGRETAPAMVALMTGPATAEPCGIHRTFLRADGAGKANVERVRQMLGPAGVIRLTPDEDVALGLGVCEGIETGLSVMARGWRPIWACGSLPTLRCFPVLAGIECLTVFADGKANEIEGACQCARRWIAAGKEAHVRWSGEPDMDFNDLDLRGAT
jgi:hypothetical protein